MKMNEIIEHVTIVASIRKHLTAINMCPHCYLHIDMST